VPWCGSCVGGLGSLDLARVSKDLKNYILKKIMHMIMFLLDGKRYSWGSAGVDLVFITSSYLY